MRKYFIFVTLLTLYTVSMILLGFKYTGSPLTQKKEKIDQQRISKLYDVKYKIENYYRDNNKLPNNLTDIKVTKDSLTVFKDSQLDYKVLNTREFQLCNYFELDKSQDSNALGRNLNYYADENFTAHGSGYQCTTLQVMLNTHTTTATPIYNTAPAIDYFTYKGDSDPKDDLVVSGKLISKDLASDNTTVIAFVIEKEDTNRMLFLLDEKSEIRTGTGWEAAYMNMFDIKINESVEVTYGKTTNGADYARKVIRVL